VIPARPSIQKPSRRDVLRRLVASGVVLSASTLLLTNRAVLADPTVHQVDIRQFVYEPAVQKVQPGDTIRWTNHDIAPHTATADDYAWDTGELAKGESAEIVVTADMPTDYFCVFHPHMKAKLIMLPA